MKIKRIAFVTSLALCLFAVTSIVASAATGTISDSEAFLDGYITGVEGPLTITDKIWYQGYLYGDDAQWIVAPSLAYSDDNKVFVVPGTDQKSLGRKYLWDSRRFVSGDQVSCGYGGYEARLKLHVCQADELTISETLL